MDPLSRRDLAQIVAGMAASRAIPARAYAQAAAQGTAGPTYIGPLTSVDHGIEDRHFDPVAPRKLRFQARTRTQAEAWQKKLRAKLTELIGGFPADRPPLRPATLETRAFRGYRREKVVFDSRPGVSVLAYVLIPDKVKTPAPAVICVPGHGRGVDDIVGIDEKGGDRTDKAAAGYAHDFAIQVVEAGGQQRLDGRWHNPFAGRRLRKQRQHLLDEQRVTLCCLADAVA